MFFLLLLSVSASPQTVKEGSSLCVTCALNQTSLSFWTSRHVAKKDTAWKDTQITFCYLLYITRLPKGLTVPAYTVPQNCFASITRALTYYTHFRGGHSDMHAVLHARREGTSLLRGPVLPSRPFWEVNSAATPARSGSLIHSSFTQQKGKNSPKQSFSLRLFAPPI